MSEPETTKQQRKHVDAAAVARSDLNIFAAVPNERDIAWTQEALKRAGR